MAEEYRQLWDILCGGLEQCAALLGDQPMDLDEFAALFRLVLSQYEVGAIPVSLDRVTAGETTRQTGHQVKALILLGADDGSIRQPEINDLRRVLDRADIRAIFTTGTKAAALYRRYCLPVTGRPAIPLPSTSPANCRATLDDLTQAYRAILAYI